MSPVLVTGGSGYVGTQLIAARLRRGRAVRASVRSPRNEADIPAAVRNRQVYESHLEVVVADLTADDGWADGGRGA